MPSCQAKDNSLFHQILIKRLKKEISIVDRIYRSKYTSTSTKLTCKSSTQDFPPCLGLKLLDQIVNNALECHKTNTPTPQKKEQNHYCSLVMHLTIIQPHLVYSYMLRPIAAFLKTRLQVETYSRVFKNVAIDHVWGAF